MKLYMLSVKTIAQHWAIRGCYATCRLLIYNETIMLHRLKQISIKSIINALKDVRIVGLIAFGVIVLLVTWSGVNVIQQNYALQQQIAQLEQEIAIQELENANLALRNEYYNTDQYLELQARRQFGLAAPGETVQIVPEQVALDNSVPFPDEEQDNNTDELQKPVYRENLEAWLDFFFRGLRGSGD